MKNYIHSQVIHNQSAASVVVPIILKKQNIKSVVDFGCGLGNWLLEFQNNGISRLKGYEYNIDIPKLVVNKAMIEQKDLTQWINCDTKYDLAICLEVAEHLPAESADILIRSLTDHSDFILFSAALPMQGGQNHINEQPFMYWVDKFNKLGYDCSSLIRNEIWDNKKVDWWYKQNMLIVRKISQNEISQETKIVNSYHPEYVEALNEQLKFTDFVKGGGMGINYSMKILYRAIKNKFPKNK